MQIQHTSVLLVAHNVCCLGDWLFQHRVCAAWRLGTTLSACCFDTTSV